MLTFSTLRLSVFYLLILLFNTPASGQAASPETQLTVGDTSTDSITLDWLTDQLGTDFKARNKGAHLDHFHHRYTWKKLGITVRVNKPGGFITGVTVAYKKAKVKARRKLNKAVTFLSGGALAGKDSSRDHFQQAGWSEAVYPVFTGSDPTKRTAIYKLKGDKFNITAVFRRGRAELEEVGAAFWE